MNAIPTNHGPMSAESIVDYLTYSNYRHNRNLSPHITPEQWAKCGYPNVTAMEAKYQTEIAITNAARTGNDHSTAVGGDAPVQGGTRSKA